jgi:hypothetical protein
MSMVATMAEFYRFVKKPDKQGLNHKPEKKRVDQILGRLARDTR